MRFPHPNLDFGPAVDRMLDLEHFTHELVGIERTCCGDQGAVLREARERIATVLAGRPVPRGTCPLHTEPLDGESLAAADDLETLINDLGADLRTVR